MSLDKLCCGKFVGKIYMQEREDFCPTVAAPWSTPTRFIGNASQLQFNNEVETITKKDYTTPGGGTACTVTTTELKIALTMECIKAWTLAEIGFLGTSQYQNLAAQTGILETHRVNAACDLIVTQRMIDTSTAATAPVVTDVGGATTYVAGVDYNVVYSGSGIEITEMTTIPVGSDIEITYDSPVQTLGEILTKSAKNYRLIFVGVNEAEGDRPVRFEVKNVKFTPTSSFDIIGDEFAMLEVEGSVLRDECLMGTNAAGDQLSQYGNFTFGPSNIS